MTQILLEKYLASQFKFGFELEAMVEDALIDFSDDYHDEVDYDSLNEAIKEEISTAFNFSEDEIEIKYDGSLEPSNRFDYAFEWATPTMQFTPENLKRSLHGLEYLVNNNFEYEGGDEAVENFKRVFNIDSNIISEEEYTDGENQEEMPEEVTEDSIHNVEEDFSNVEESEEPQIDFETLDNHDQSGLEPETPPDFE